MQHNHRFRGALATLTLKLHTRLEALTLQHNYRFQGALATLTTTLIIALTRTLALALVLPHNPT